MDGWDEADEGTLGSHPSGCGLLLGWGLTRDALALTHATISPAVFSQGDKGTSWFIVWKGSVNVVTHGKVGASPRLHPIPAVTLVPRCTPFLQPDLGQVQVWVSPVPLQGLVATLHEGDDFGQLALVNDAPRAASIILREDNCHFLRVDKQDFNRILKVGSWDLLCWAPSQDLPVAVGCGVCSGMCKVWWLQGDGVQ